MTYFHIVPGVHNVLSYLGVYKLPLGVTNIPGRRLSFNITKSAKLFSPLVSIYPKGFPAEFSLLITIKFQYNYSGNFLTLSDLMGKQQFALSYSTNSINVNYFDKTNKPELESPGFDDKVLSDNTWYQVALSFSGNEMEIYIDCDNVQLKNFKRSKEIVSSSNLMLSLGPYFARHGPPFEVRHFFYYITQFMMQWQLRANLIGTDIQNSLTNMKIALIVFIKPPFMVYILIQIC